MPRPMGTAGQRATRGDCLQSQVGNGLEQSMRDRTDFP